MLRTLFTLLLLTHAGIYLHARTSAVDSLQHELTIHTKEDSTRAKIFIKLANEYNQLNLEKSLAYSIKGEKLSEKINFKRGFLSALSVKASTLQRLGRTSEALDIYNEIIKRDLAGNNKLLVAIDYQNVSLVYSSIGLYEKAIGYTFKALKLFEELKDDNNCCIAFYTLSQQYFYINKYDLCLKYAKKAVRIAKKTNNKRLMPYVYLSMAACFNAEKQKDSAFVYMTEVIRLGIQNNDPYMLSIAYIDLSETWMQKKQLDSAFYYTEKAIYFSRLIGYPESLAMAFVRYSANLLEKSKIQREQKNGLMKKGLMYVDSAIAINAQINDLEGMLRAYEAKFKIYDAWGKTDSALAYHKKFKQLNDSLFTSELDKKREELHVQYEVDKKDQRNKALVQKTKIQQLELERGRYLLYLIIAIVLVIIVAAIFYIRQQRIRALQRTIIAEQKLLRSQMNPHFIFNSLTAIESFIYSNQPKEAGRYLSDFARLIRLILENSREEEISLDKEIKTLEYYLIMQQLRMEDKLEYKIEVDSAIDTQQVFVPPMLTQPFIENAIEHGIRPTGKKGLITVSFRLDEKYLRIDVTDNGIGITGNENKNLNHKSLALEIINERLDALNKMRKYKSFVRVANLTNEETTGTQITLTLALQ